VIQQDEERLHRPTETGVIVNPPGMPINISLDHNFQLKTVTVHSPALMANRHMGQSLGGLKKEIFGEAGFHGGSLPFPGYPSREKWKELVTLSPHFPSNRTRRSQHRQPGHGINFGLYRRRQRPGRHQRIFCLNLDALSHARYQSPWKCEQRLVSSSRSHRIYLNWDLDKKRSTFAVSAIDRVRYTKQMLT
jgi:hypothetical protein